ncbi:LptF/LptG family permease [candidate division KSB1 bacterium]
MKLYLYIIKEHIGPFFLGLAVLTFVLLMKQVFRLLDLLLGKDLAPVIVVELFSLTLPFILALTVPMAVLVAVLMAFGRLSQDNEIMAIKAGGIGLHRIMAPVVGVASILCVGMIFFNNSILPESNHKLKNLLLDIRQMRPTLDIQERMYLEDFSGYKIYFKEIDYRTSEVDGVWIWETRPGKPPRDIYAESGVISTRANTVIMTLFDGSTSETDRVNPDVSRQMTFDSQIIKLPMDQSLKRHNRNYRGDREMSAQAMWAQVDRSRADVASISSKVDSLGVVASAYEEEKEEKKLQAAQTQMASLEQALKIKRHQIDRYLVEIHKKYSIPVACIIFVLIGAPLGVVSRRGGMGGGFGLSAGFFVLYYICLIGGEEVADRGMVDPFLGMWAANILIGVVGIILTSLALRDRLGFIADLFQYLSVRRLLEKIRAGRR